MLKVQSNNLKISDCAFLGCSPKLNQLPNEVKDMVLV